MRRSFPVSTGLCAGVLAGLLGVLRAAADDEITVTNGAVIRGTVKVDGKVPPPPRRAACRSTGADLV